MKNIVCVLKRKTLNLMPDKLYLKLKFRKEMGKRLNLKKPQTFNEKMQWLKLYDRKPIYTKMVDKYEAREYIKEKIGEEYLVPLLGVYEEFNDIDFSSLPNQFVIKATHDSGSTIVCKNKEVFNFKEADKKISKSLKSNYFYLGREWPYKNIKPKIIIEKYLKNEKDDEDLIDYKFFCFNTNKKIILVCSERTKNFKKTWYDENWNLLDIKEGGHDIDKDIEKPINLKEMLKLSEKLSKGFPFLRVDFYEVDKKIYFGELTFYPSAGFEKFEPPKYNKILGDWIDLNKIS